MNKQTKVKRREKKESEIDEEELTTVITDDDVGDDDDDHDHECFSKLSRHLVVVSQPVSKANNASSSEAKSQRGKVLRGERTKERKLVINLCLIEGLHSNTASLASL